MNTYLWIVPFLGLTTLIVFLFLAFQRWTAGKQQQMSPEEFRLWFQKNYMGVAAGGNTPMKSATAPRNSRNATVDRPKP